MDDIGKKIKERRLALGLTLEEVGAAVGVGKSTVRKWENGIIKNMGRDKIANLARVLNMNPVEFVPMKVAKTEPKRLFAYDAAPVIRANVENYGPKEQEVKEVSVDPELKAVLKLWKVSTPAARKAAVQVLRTLSKEETK